MNDSTADSLRQLRDALGSHLYAAAENLVEQQGVRDVRVLQAGNVIVGIADGDTSPRASHRVYIRNRSREPGRSPHGGASDGNGIEGECSCGERHPCIHVAAVLIAAARGANAPARGVPQPQAVPQRFAPAVPAAAAAGRRQHLGYLLELEAPQAGSGAVVEQLRLSIWVGQAAVRGACFERDSAHPFVARGLIGGHSASTGGTRLLPRYVDAHDEALLVALTAQQIDGPWLLHGATGAGLLKQVIASGRACWQSLNAKPLCEGASRRVGFEWETLPDGNQQLRLQVPASINVALSVEPAVYIDTATGECGDLELPYAQTLLQQFWMRAPITPEQAEAENKRIARGGGVGSGSAEGFPRLRTLLPEKQPLASLKAKLVLSAGPQATLYFLYNGVPVDGRRLNPSHTTVRQMDGDVLREIDRDRDTERQLHAQLQQAFADTVPKGQSSDWLARDSWLAFMMKAVPALQAQDWEVVTEDGFPYRIATPGNWYADLERGAPERETEWFDLRLGVVVDGHAVNLLPALAAFLQAQLGKDTTDRPADEPSYCRVGEHLMVRLDDGRYIPVAVERIQRIAHTLVELADRGALNAQQALSLPASHASRLAQLAGGLNASMPVAGGGNTATPIGREAPAEGSGEAVLRSDDASLVELIEGIEDASRLAPLPAPAGFRATLRPYQEQGLGWLEFLRRHRLGGILADDMGLGKTVQTLAHLLREKQHGRLRKPSLIVAPVSVIGNWSQEIRRFAPDLQLLTLHGARRKETFGNIDTSDIVITSYPLLQLDSETLLAHEFYYVILDEAQMIKNPRAKVSQFARQLRAEHRLCLTGTPMENHLGELWSLFDFLQPGLLGEEKHFQRHYRTPIEKNGDTERFQALTRRIAPLLLRRTKDVVAKELPPKTQIVEPIVLEERQRDLYDSIRLRMHRRVREILQSQGLARSHITVLDALLKLRQACCDPRLVGTDPDTRSVPSAKMDWLQTVLPELVAEGRRVLLFSQFTSMLKLVEAAVTELGIPYCLLTGETQQRAAVVERFESGAVPLFLISLKAGGTGLNLTAADTVIHYDPWWNPAAEAQATDRAHRIGQDKPVFVYKLIAQGTVEEKILRLQENKQSLASQLHAADGALPAQLGAAEVEALFE